MNVHSAIEFVNVFALSAKLIWCNYQKFKFLICWVLTFSENPLARMFEHTFWALIWESAQPILWIAWEKCLLVNMASNDQLPSQQLAKVYGGTLCVIFWAWTQKFVSKLFVRKIAIDRNVMNLDILWTESAKLIRM